MSCNINFMLLVSELFWMGVEFSFLSLGGATLYISGENKLNSYMV